MNYFHVKLLDNDSIVQRTYYIFPIEYILVVAILELNSAFKKKTTQTCRSTMLHGTDHIGFKIDMKIKLGIKLV